jgi:hypothetical protein
MNDVVRDSGQASQGLRRIQVAHQRNCPQRSQGCAFVAIARQREDLEAPDEPGDRSPRDIPAADDQDPSPHQSIISRQVSHVL